jgi:hypothetical protein
MYCVFLFLNDHHYNARILEVMFTNIQKTSSFSIDRIVKNNNTISKSPLPLYRTRATDPLPLPRDVELKI